MHIALNTLYNDLNDYRGGVPTLVNELVRDLSAAGHVVSVFTRSKADRTSQPIEGMPNARVFALPGLNAVTKIPVQLQTGSALEVDQVVQESVRTDLAWALSEASKDGRGKVDVLEAFDGQRRWEEFAAAVFEVDVPVVVSLHTNKDLYAERNIGPGWMSLLRDYPWRSIITVNADDVAMLERNGIESTLQREIVVIPPSINTAVFRPEAEINAGLSRYVDSGTRIYGVLAARLKHDKGADIALNAFIEDRRSGFTDSVLLLPAPDETDEQQLEASTIRSLATAAGLVEGREYFFESFAPQDVPGVYRAIEQSGGAVLAPSERESFGKVVVEAAACGALVIAADNIGFRQNIGRVPEAELIPVADRSAAARGFAVQMRAFREDAPRRATVIAAQMRMAHEFSPHETVQKRLTVYASVSRARAQEMLHPVFGAARSRQLSANPPPRSSVSSPQDVLAAVARSAVKDLRSEWSARGFTSWQASFVDSLNLRLDAHRSSDGERQANVLDAADLHDDVVLNVARAIHEAYRDFQISFREQQTRMRPTSDRVWLARAKERDTKEIVGYLHVTGNGEVTRDVDLLQWSLDELPTDWQADNIRLAQVLVASVGANLAEGRTLDEWQVQTFATEFHWSGLEGRRDEGMPVDVGARSAFDRIEDWRQELTVEQVEAGLGAFADVLVDRLGVAPSEIDRLFNRSGGIEVSPTHAGSDADISVVR